MTTWNADIIAERIKASSVQSSYSDGEKIEQFWKLLVVSTRYTIRTSIRT